MKLLPPLKSSLRYGLAACVVMGASCLLASPARAATIYSEDFTNVTTGWTAGTTSAGTISFDGGAPSGSSFTTPSLKLSHVPASTTRLTSTSPANQFSIARTSSESYTFQFDLRLSRENTGGYVVFYDANASSQLPMFVHITGGGFQIGYWNGTANAAFTLLASYEVDTTYTFTFTTTPSTNLFSASVTGGTAELVNQGYRRTSGGLDSFASFNRIQIYNDGGAGSGASYDMYIDNILIQTIPEPTVITGLLLGGLLIMGRRIQSSRRRS